MLVGINDAFDSMFDRLFPGGVSVRPEMENVWNGKELSIDRAERIAQARLDREIWTDIEMRRLTGNSGERLGDIDEALRSDKAVDFVHTRLLA
jgi:hypothetical protein